ncbi:MAG: MFS transporter [bacterium]|nr:MFS transporter [bacterium]
MERVIQYNKNAVMWLVIAHCVCDIYGGFLNPIMPFIAEKLGFSLGIATILVAITQICSNMLQPIFGFFADNIQKRFFVFWGLILASVFIPLAASAPNIILLNLFMILGCLGGSFFHPQSLGFVNIFSQDKCSKNMGLFVCLGSFGFALGPLFAALLTQTVGLDNISYASIFGIAVALIMFLFVPKLSLNSTKTKHYKFFQTFKEIFNNKQMNIIMLVAMMKSLITNSACILLPFLWKQIGYSAFNIGFLLFLFVFFGSIGSLISPYIENKYGTKSVLYFSMLATFPMMIIFSYTYETSYVFSTILISIMGLTTNLAQPVVLVAAQKTLPKYKSIVAGFVNGFCWGTVALILSILGSIAQKYGIINVLIILSIIPVIFSYFVKFINEKNC